MLNEEEKKYAYIAITIILILLIIVIILIWTPMFSGSQKEDLNIFEVYDSSAYVENMKEEYKNILLDLLKENNYDLLFEKMDKNFLEQNNFDKNSLREFLYSNNLFIGDTTSVMINNKSVSSDKEVYLYTYEYSYDENIKYVHIRESYPGSYYISFEQDNYPIINNDGFLVTNGDVSYKITVVESNQENVTFNFEITNNSNDRYVFDLSSLNSSSATINNGEKCYLDSVVSGNESSNLEVLPGGVYNVKLTYNINIENQNNILYFEFYNVLNNNIYSTITLAIR